MDFISGALPNVMFLVGIIAMGIGLGIEFKIVEVKGELSKGARIGALGVGAGLIISSIVLYTRPTQTAGAPVQAAAQVASVADAPASAASVPPSPIPTAPATATPPPTTTPTELPTATALPTATSVPTALPTETPTATPPPTAVPTETPTATPPPTPTETPAPTALPGVVVPDIRGQNPKDVAEQLRASGLEIRAQKGKCEDIGVKDEDRREVRKGQIACQQPAPGSIVPPDTTIIYVLAGKGEEEQDD